MNVELKATRIKARLTDTGRALQVRFHSGMFLTYPVNCSRGYGIHGKFVGIYTKDVPIEWIIDDIEEFNAKT